MGVIVSPELALVDEELRAAACAELPPVGPYGFVEAATDPPDRHVHAPTTLRGWIRVWRIRARPALHWFGVVLVGGIAGVLVGRFLSHV